MELGKNGKSIVQIAAALGFSRRAIYDWTERYPEFKEAMDWARQLAQAWWEDQGQTGIWSKEFNANAYSLQIRNRFPDEWRDKQDHAVQGGITIQISSTDEQL